MSHTPTDITILLRAAATGDRTDLDALMHALYDDMRRLAVSHLAAERPDHTLQPTALVHEAYLKLVDQRSTDWKDRLHFFAVAARVIRRILIDHARERNALKRGGADRPVRLTDHDAPGAERGVDLVALDEALADLAQIDERQARVVELKFFAGCGIDEIAELLGVGRRTVDRDWMAARAWLFDRLAEPDGRPGDRADGR
jgi:RNA polymerase sigma factor (TIGR02999 family)